VTGDELRTEVTAIRAAGPISTAVLAAITRHSERLAPGDCAALYREMVHHFGTATEGNATLSRTVEARVQALNRQPQQPPRPVMAGFPRQPIPPPWGQSQPAPDPLARQQQMFSERQEQQARNWGEWGLRSIKR
jgi:hypothetical protein